MDAAESHVAVIARVVAGGAGETTQAGRDPCIKVREDRLVALTCNPFMLDDSEKGHGRNNDQGVEEPLLGPRLFEYIFTKVLSETEKDESFIDAVLDPCIELLESNKDVCIALYGQKGSETHKQ